MDSDEATALNKRYCDRKQELKEDFKPDDYNGMGIKRRGKQHMTNSGNHPKYVSDINNEAHNV